MAHLEALEMLSNESESKVQRLLSAMSAARLSKVKPELVQIKETFELTDFDDEGKEFSDGWLNVFMLNVSQVLHDFLKFSSNVHGTRFGRKVRARHLQT